MKLHARTISDLAEMICGDEPWKNFPYRSSSYLSDFFGNCETDHRHDGTTRRHWVRSVLDELNIAPGASPTLPADGIVRAVQELMDASDFGKQTKDRGLALSDLNKMLARDGIEVFIDGADRCHVRDRVSQKSSASLAVLQRRAWTPSQLKRRQSISEFLDAASEDEFTTKVLVPLFTQLGFIRVSVAGHKDKLLEYGKDLWMKYQLPTSHFIYFGAQIKKGKLDSAANSKGKNENIAEIHNQMLMMMGNPVFDPELNRKVLLDHVFIIASGEITKPARAWLAEKLDADKRRQIIFMDWDEILDLATAINLELTPEPPTGTAEVDIPF